MTQLTRVLRLRPEDRDRLHVLFLAKHALATGAPDAEDGNHAVYHHEVRTTLEKLGIRVSAADSFDAITRKPDADYVFTLLNRAGFQNSEMLGPTLLTGRGVPFLGASPIIRGVADDKHLMKRLAVHHGLPVAPWAIYRRGGEPLRSPDFGWDRLVVKPNASSASWGVGIYDGWSEARDHAEALIGEGQDVIVERHVGDQDVVVAAIGVDDPVLLPPTRFVLPGTDDNFRSYEEKRALVGGSGGERLTAIGDGELARRIKALAARLLPELWPFDYGRFEFRHDRRTGALAFMEVNLSCNLWSKKTVAGAAALVGYGYPDLIETILAHSLRRQGVIRGVDVEDRLPPKELLAA